MTGFFGMFFGDIISVISTLVITGFFVYVLSRCIKSRKELETHKAKLDGVLNDIRVIHDVDENAALVTYGEKKETSKEDMSVMQQEFDEACAEYDVISQLTAIFPSLGILGTVLGLMYQVSASGLDEMTGSIGLALGSTFLALTFVIIIKLYSIRKIVNCINACEISYAQYERKKQNRIVDRMVLDKE